MIRLCLYLKGFQMTLNSFSEAKCKEFLERSEDEILLAKWVENENEDFDLVLTEGFEKRTTGILKFLANNNIKIKKIVIGRYEDRKLNEKYRDLIEELSESVAPGNWKVLDNRNDGLWISEAINLSHAKNILIDITSMSNRSLFGGLNASLTSNRQVYIGYSEALQYWPKKEDWEKLKNDLSDSENLTEVMDQMPWLFGDEHHVDLVPNHEGYDSVGSKRALIGFLPFKCARLKAILSQEDYADGLYIAGRPHLEENYWRVDALKKINEPIVKNWNVIDIGTFNYRRVFKSLSNILLSDDSLFEKYDIHLAILGSKLQTVACWALSRIFPSITVITSSPKTYHKNAYTGGIGNSWVFKLVSPENIKKGSA